MAPSALQQLKTIFDAWQWIVLFKKVANKGEAIVIAIVDTNLARNENSYSELLGNRKQLQAIAASNELYIPEVVIDEIVAQKRLSFLREQAQINRSGILKLTSFSMNEAESLTFEQVEEEIRSDRSIQFKVLPQAPVEYAFSLYTSGQLITSRHSKKGAIRVLKMPALSHQSTILSSSVQMKHV